MPIPLALGTKLLAALRIFFTVPPKFPSAHPIFFSAVPIFPSAASKFSAIACFSMIYAFST